ncbi:MAG: hypothetical protein ACJATT_000388 [Myxococcota bacterium]|jgi:hypothetical protein
MGHVRVTAATVADGKIQSLGIELKGLGARTIDRDTTVSWMRDGHSFVPVTNGKEGPALQLIVIEDGDAVEYAIRNDHETTAEDSLPALPSA